MLERLSDPQYKARLLLLAQRRVLGGKGSGNFDHHGRPGQVGGSSSSNVSSLREKTAHRVADRMGFPKERIQFKDLAADKFTLNGQEYSAGGFYARGERQIDISSTTQFTPRELRYVVAHEISHDAFEQVYNQERSFYDPTSPGYGRRPFHTDIVEFHDSFRKELPSLQATGSDITEYASDYWKQYRTTKAKSDLMRAVDETFAEISALKEIDALPWDANLDPLKKQWIGLHDKLMKAYAGKNDRATDASPLLQKITGRKKLRAAEVIQGKSANIVYLEKPGGKIVAPELATFAIARFEDGSVLYFVQSVRTPQAEDKSQAGVSLTRSAIASGRLDSAVKISALARSKRPETEVHSAADRYAARMTRAIATAFALGRRALPKAIRTPDDLNGALLVIDEALARLLPAVLQDTLVAGGEAGTSLVLRSAGEQGSEGFDCAGRSGQIGVSSSRSQSGDHHDVVPGFSTTSLRDNAALVPHAASRAQRAMEETRSGKLEDFPEHFHAEDVSLRSALEQTEAPVLSREDPEKYFCASDVSDRIIIHEPLRTAAKIHMTFDRENPEVSRWARRHAGELITDIGKETRRRIRDVIVDLTSQDLSMREARSRIADLLGDRKRADLIARTETMKAANVGLRQSWNQAIEEGLLTGRERQQWIATGDACDECLALDGQTVRIGKTFRGGIDGPPAHPRCRCTIGLVG